MNTAMPGDAGAAGVLSRAQPWLGTRVEIHLCGLGREQLFAASADAFAAISEVHRRMSFHSPTSDLSRLHSGAGGPVSIHPWTRSVLEAALAFEDESDGAFDVTVAGRLVLWGLLPRPAGAHGGAETARGLREALELLPGAAARLRYPVLVDLGGIAKGFAVDRAIDALRAAGVPAALVNAGGDLRAFGRHPWPVWIRDPRHPERASGGLALDDGALATSGPYFAETLHRGRRVSPLVDPRLGAPILGSRSVSILAPTCLEADALTKIALAGAPARVQRTLERHGAWQLCAAHSGPSHA